MYPLEFLRSRCTKNWVVWNYICSILLELAHNRLWPDSKHENSWHVFYTSTSIAPYSTKYGKYLQVKESKDVVIIDEIEDNSGFAYLKPKGKVFCVRILITTYLYFE